MANAQPPEYRQVHRPTAELGQDTLWCKPGHHKWGLIGPGRPPVAALERLDGAPGYTQAIRLEDKIVLRLGGLVVVLRFGPAYPL